jgi:aspartyl-tRNA(Asn)/glutamyl-tRNA(Gln) amidotransferase subunit C
MISNEDVKKLASLSRIEITPEEEEAFVSEIDSILGYVGQISNLQPSTSSQELPSVRNVFRSDGKPHETGIFTDEILNQAPAREKNYIKVKKILNSPAQNF